MTDVAKIIRDALVLCGQMDATEAPEAEDLADAMTALNRMMRVLELEGINLGWSDVSSPAQEVPIPPEAEEAVVYNLSIRLGAAYGLPLREVDVAVASAGLAQLRAYCAAHEYARLSYPDLPAGSGRSNGRWSDGFNH